MSRILIVEDDPANMRLAALLLEGEGYEVLQAADAELGLRVARDQAPDLVLLDVHLPDMDGLAVARLLRADRATSEIRIIALTALAMSGDRERAEAAGCVDHISKPYQHQELLRVVGHWLNQPPP